MSLLALCHLYYIDIYGTWSSCRLRTFPILPAGHMATYNMRIYQEASLHPSGGGTSRRLMRAAKEQRLVGDKRVGYQACAYALNR